VNKKEISSGAQKAEALADNGKKPAAKKNTAVKSTAKAKKTAPVKQTKDNAKNGNKVMSIKKSAKKKGKHVHKMSEKRRKRLEAREQKKLEAAKIRAEKKQKRLEKRLDAKQKRLDRIAAMKEKRAEAREKRRERRDMLKHETKEARIERKRQARVAKTEARVAKREAAMADRRAKREHRLKVRAEKRAEKNEKRHAPGFGGWLAAVISLGVVTLALGSMLTYGWINMDGMTADMATIHTESMYELNSIVDNLDTNLAKARVANTRNEQVKLLSNVAIESEMAETLLERLPVDTQFTQNVTSFVNKMGDSAQSMLYSVASGKKLTDSQIATIEHMYKTNLQLKQSINELTANCTGKEMLKAMRGKKDNLMLVSFGEMENNVVETPKEIHDGPFAENIKKVSAKNLAGLEEITCAQAEKLAAKYFESYNVSDVKCTGEVTAESLTCYNVTMQTKDGEMSAQLSKQGGKVVEFNSYKDCNDKNFSVERCVDIAQDFLKALGFKNMKAVWTSENGTTCNLNFAYEQNGVVIYPDMVKVKVCEERGIVTGMEGLAYVLNHTQRELGSAKISKSDAKAVLNGGFEAEGSRLCLIPVDGGEVLCYEFYGTYGGNDYYIYVDAATGNEVEVFTVIGTAQGKALM
jgi:spore germination protein